MSTRLSLDLIWGRTVLQIFNVVTHSLDANVYVFCFCGETHNCSRELWHPCCRNGMECCRSYTAVIRVVYDQCFCCCFRYGRALYFQRKRRDSVSQLRLLVDDGSNDLKIWLVVDLKFLNPAKSASTHHNVLPRISGFSDILPVDTIMVIITYSWNRCCDLVNRQSFP